MFKCDTCFKQLNKKYSSKHKLIHDNNKLKKYSINSIENIPSIKNIENSPIKQSENN